MLIYRIGKSEDGEPSRKTQRVIALGVTVIAMSFIGIGSSWLYEKSGMADADRFGSQKMEFEINQQDIEPYDDVSASNTQDDSGGLSLTVIPPDKVRTTFDNVAGQNEAKEEVKEIIDFMKHPGKYKKLGATLPKGVLLYGPPGTGKTLLARAVAGESGVTFIAVDGASFDEMYVGVGAKRVRELFKAARKYAPVIVFIDEIDALAPPRDVRDSSGRAQTINQLLAEMDNVVDEKNKDIIIMAATNRLDNIDSAILRPGRFDRKVYIRLPNHAERESILNLFMSTKPVSEEVSAKSIAGTTHGFSGADIKNLVNEAALHAARNNKEIIDKDDFGEAIDKIKLGLKIETAIVSQEQKLLTAYHEAGHTIVGLLAPNYDYAFHKVTVGVRDATLGVTHFEALDDDFSNSKAHLQSQIAVSLGGRIAEEMHVGKDFVTTGASSDLRSATKIAQHMVMEGGVSDISEYTSFASLENPPQDKINDEIDRILKKGYEMAYDILNKNRDKLDKLAAALMKKDTLDRSEVLGILGIEEPEEAVSEQAPESEKPEEAAGNSDDPEET